MPSNRVYHDLLNLVAIGCNSVASNNFLRNLAVFTLIGWCGLLSSGCQSFQKRLAQGSSRCGELCERAREARERGNSAQANQLIDEALQQPTNDLEMRRELAETMWNNGRRTEAMAEFVSLCESRPNDGHLASRLAIMQWDSGQKSIAATTAANALEINPHLPDALLVKARSEAERGKFDDALASYNRLAHIVPDDPTMLLEMGDLQLRRNHPDRACPLFRAAVQSRSLSAEQQAKAEWLLGVAYGQSGRWALAVSTLEAAIEHKPPNAEDRSYLGWAHLQNGDLGAAESNLQRALECDPKSPAARSLARKLEASGDSLANSKRVSPAAYRETSLEGGGGDYR